MKPKLSEGQRALLQKLRDEGGAIQWSQLRTVESRHGTELSRRKLTRWEERDGYNTARVALHITEAGREALEE